MAIITTSQDNVLPWLIDVDVFEQAVANTNWDTVTINTSALLNAWKQSTGSQNAELNFDIPLAAGTWTIELMHTQSTDRGVYTVQLDGATVGSVEGYAAAATYNVLSSVTGVVVSTTAKKRLKIVMATKNASSTSYFGAIQHIQFRRTDVSGTAPSVSIDNNKLPWHIDLNPFMTPISSVGTWSSVVNTSCVYNGYRQAGYTQTAEFSYDVVLAAGTWDLEVMQAKQADKAIITVQFDGVAVGTHDGYFAGTTYNVKTITTGVVVPTAKKVRMKLTTATKNASSSNYQVFLQHIQLRRTT